MAQVGMLLKCVANPPIAVDFSCGFQSDLSSGTRSSVLRVFAISLSNSGNNDSLSAILILLVRLGFRFILRSWVDKYRTGSGSDRVQHSARLGLATLFTPLGVYVDSTTRSVPLPDLHLSND